MEPEKNRQTYVKEIRCVDKNRILVDQHMDQWRVLCVLVCTFVFYNGQEFNKIASYHLKKH